MGVHLDESELADLEPQIHKIFKKELGFFDNSTFTSTMATIHSGVEREGLQGHLENELGESKKVIKLSEEVGTSDKILHQAEKCFCCKDLVLGQYSLFLEFKVSKSILLFCNGKPSSIFLSFRCGR